jgi:hypothetical protein
LLCAKVLSLGGKLGDFVFLFPQLNHSRDVLGLLRKNDISQSLLFYRRIRGWNLGWYSPLVRERALALTYSQRSAFWPANQKEYCLVLDRNEHNLIRGAAQYLI